MTADSQLAANAGQRTLGRCYVERLRMFRDRIVDRAIAVAKQHGYSQYTTTIRAAWVEAFDSLTDAVDADLLTASSGSPAPRADVCYRTSERLAAMRSIARRHRSIGITFEMYLGLFKHFRSIYLDALDDVEISESADRETRRQLRDQLLGFFDAAELSVGADWVGAPEDDQLAEMQAKSRSIALDKDRYLAVFESLRDPAFLLDRQRRLLNANQAAAQLFVGDSGAGDIVYVSASRDRKSLLEEVLRAATTVASKADQVVWLDTRKGRLCFDLREREIHDALGNTRLGWVVILHDVTNHRRATEEAERARRAMSTFLATVSHEIRTPLHSVLGATELLRGADARDHGSYVDAIETAGRHLLQTFNKVLDYSYLEARTPSAKPRPCELQASLSDLAKVVAITAERAGTRLDVDMARNLSRRLDIDWAMTEQVLTNLLSNALRHDSGAGVRLRVRRRYGHAEGSRLYFEVADQGGGVDADSARLLFEPFGARTPASSTSCGAGLGLAISRILVESMGGRIGFKNDDRAGAVFWFDLPYRPVAGRAPDSASMPAAMEAPDTAGLTCLLVDDDDIGRTVTADRLRRYGVDVQEAASGAEAMRMADDADFDVFLIDYYLPDDSGVWLVQRLRGRLRHPARFVALTANVDSISFRDELGSNFDSVLAKPAMSQDLLAAIGRPPARLARMSERTQSAALADVSPRVARLMAETFVANWPGETGKLQEALHRACRAETADLAHRLASSCAVMGIADLASELRNLESACREPDGSLEMNEWLERLGPQLRAAPGRAEALAAQV